MSIVLRSTERRFLTFAKCFEQLMTGAGSLLSIIVELKHVDVARPRVGRA